MPRTTCRHDLHGGFDVGRVQCSDGTPPQPAGGEFAERTPAACGGTMDLGAVASMERPMQEDASDMLSVRSIGRGEVMFWKDEPTEMLLRVRGLGGCVDAQSLAVAVASSGSVPRRPAAQVAIATASLS